MSWTCRRLLATAAIVVAAASCASDDGGSADVAPGSSSTDAAAPTTSAPPTEAPSTTIAPVVSELPSTTRPSAIPGSVPVIIDSDANNELDDQHALAYAALRPDLFDLVAVTANATSAGGTVDAHAAEAERVLALADRVGDVPVYAGADGTFDEIRPFLDDPDHDGHAAVDAIIDAARSNGELVLLPIGKLTNVALALDKAPDIADGLRVLWLGSNYPQGTPEYNLDNDPGALSFVLDDGVDAGLEFEIVTVRPGDTTGTAAVDLSIDEALARMPGLGPTIDAPIVGRTGMTHSTFGDYSAELFRTSTPFGDPPSRSLFDLAAVALVGEPSWAESVLIAAPSFVAGEFVDRPERQQTIRYWERFDRDAIVEDMFASLVAASE
ncbi:MAG: nucleoside hydrolase [Actinomycetota bacterium]